MLISKLVPARRADNKINTKEKKGESSLRVECSLKVEGRGCGVDDGDVVLAGGLGCEQLLKESVNIG